MLLPRGQKRMFWDVLCEEVWFQGRKHTQAFIQSVFSPAQSQPHESPVSSSMTRLNNCELTKKKSIFSHDDETHNTMLSHCPEKFPMQETPFGKQNELVMGKSS